MTNNTKVLTLIPEPIPKWLPSQGVAVAGSSHPVRNVESDTHTDTGAGSRWQLVKDVAVFQVKLLIDGARDLFLVPVSIVAGIVSLMHSGSKPGPQFYDLLRLGRQSERWINLFSAAAPAPDAAGRSDDSASSSRTPLPVDIDDLVNRVESFIVDEYANGGITAQARQRLDRALESLRAMRRSRPGSGQQN